jgi:lysophospholipase L1-like esterase
VQIVQAARARAPGARVVLVDYLTVLGQETIPRTSTPLDASEITAFRHIGDRLANAFAVAAERTGADLVPVGALSVDHAVGSSAPWVTGFRPLMKPTPFHPNAEGMRAVADAVYLQVT